MSVYCPAECNYVTSHPSPAFSVSPDAPILRAIMETRLQRIHSMATRYGNAIENARCERARDGDFPHNPPAIAHNFIIDLGKLVFGPLADNMDDNKLWDYTMMKMEHSGPGNTEMWHLTIQMR